MEEAIKYVKPSISISLGDKFVGCLGDKYVVQYVDYKDQLVTFASEKTGIERVRSFSDIACEFKKVTNIKYSTEYIKVTLGIRGTISLEVGDSITVSLGRKVKVLFIDYLNERVAISETEVIGDGRSNSLTFEEIMSGSYRKVVE